MADERPPLRVRLRVPLILLPYAAGVATAVPLWASGPPGVEEEV